jgi:hypothetical protein
MILVYVSNVISHRLIYNMIQENIKDINGNFRWVSYTVIGTVILGIMAFVFFK